MRPTSLRARPLVSAAWCSSFAALLACSGESASLQDGATGGKTAGVSTSGSGGSGSGAGGGGAGGGQTSGSGGGQTGGSGGFNRVDAATADGSADGSGVLDPVDARSDAGDVSLAADSGADVSDATAMSTDAPVLPARVLLYHFSTFAIDTVPAQLAFLRSKLVEWHLEADDSVDPAVFTDTNLARYGAVAMVNTCFEPFGAGKPDRPQSEVLQRFVQRGGGLFGNHCAAVTFANAQPPALYNQLFGGRDGNGSFDGKSNCRKTAEHVTTAGLPATFVFNGNLDNADFVANDSVVLVRCTWATGKDVAVSWYRTEGQGRVFFTNFAKVDADLKDPTLGAGHVVPGLAWVLRR